MLDNITPNEQKWLLQNPYVLADLLSYQSWAYQIAESTLDDELEPWPTRRFQDLYERGRSLIVEDGLESWDNVILKEFGFPPQQRQILSDFEIETLAERAGFEVNTLGQIVTPYAGDDSREFLLRFARLVADSVTLDSDKGVNEMRDALSDCAGGLRYVRETYGDLYGVGFDRALGKADAALARHA